MHEMSIALGIVDIATEACHKRHKKVVMEIGLEIGNLAGVEMSSLEFIWPLAVEGTVLEHAKRVIKRTQGLAKCMDCGHQYEIEKHFDNCPLCKSYIKQILCGKELRVNYLEI
jgi:hydrogenase nickel incorporation protein HypA/HybF